ncbi:hypothetical protein M406DRAFT_320420, partial [Cryphonectria parasitica EP155]
MENGSQGQSSQGRTQQGRNAVSRFPSWMNSSGIQGAGGNIWLNNHLTDNLSSRESSSATASTQRAQGIGATDSSPWSRPTASTWNSTDSQSFRPSASRSTSPKNTLQNASNTSPSFNPNRAATTQNPTFANSGLVSSFAPANYSSYTDNAQVDSGNAFQQSYMGFQRTLSSTFDDVLPPSRHSESEAPLQFGTETPGFLGSHSRHPSRLSLSAASTSFAQQPQASRSQSHSLNPGSEQAQAALESVRAGLLRDRIQASSPGPRANAAQASTPAAPQLGTWQDFTPNNRFTLANGNVQEVRRDSLANSVHQSAL